MHSRIGEDQYLIKAEIIKYNLQKISLICKVSTILIVCLVLLTTILSKIPVLHINDRHYFSFIHYLLFIIFNVMIIYVIDIRKVNLTKNNMKKIDFFICFYVTMFITIGAVLSIQDPLIYNQLMFYTLILLICCTFLVLTVEQVMIPFLISTIIIIVGLYFLNGNSVIFKLQLTYLIALLPTAFFISRFINHSYIRSIKFQIELVREAHLTRDLTKKLREANRKLELQASLDPLTKLFNRRAFNQYVHDLERKEKPYSLTALMIDVDCFKLYNDTYGHVEGDNVLMKIGQLLYQISDQHGFFASRWGGEEFSLLLINQNEETVNNICVRILKAVKQLQIQHSSSFIDSFVTISIGASTHMITEECEVSACIHQADRALYNVKERGRNNFVHLNKIELEN